MTSETEVIQLLSELDVEKLVSEFLATRYNWSMDPEGSDGQCVGRSEEFGRWLRDKGVESSKLEMGGLIPTVEKDASIFHREGIPPKYFYHCVVLVYDIIVDLSGAQFGTKYSRQVWPEAEYKRFWESSRKEKWEF